MNERTHGSTPEQQDFRNLQINIRNGNTTVDEWNWLLTRTPSNVPNLKDVRVHDAITWIKLGIPIYFIDHSEFITVQCKKILSRANNNEIKCF